MKFVTDVKQCWRWLSVQIPALNVAFLGTWAVLPAKFQEALPMPWVIGIAVGLIVLGVAGRLYKQDLPAPLSKE
jgi:protein-S-isoprenylcysteine O-methyltransferase Ste14